MHLRKVLRLLLACVAPLAQMLICGCASPSEIKASIEARLARPPLVLPNPPSGFILKTRTATVKIGTGQTPSVGSGSVWAGGKVQTVMFQPQAQSAIESDIKEYLTSRLGSASESDATLTLTIQKAFCAQTSDHSSLNLVPVIGLVTIAGDATKAANFVFLVEVKGELKKSNGEAFTFTVSIESPEPIIGIGFDKRIDAYHRRLSDVRLKLIDSLDRQLTNPTIISLAK